MAVPVPIMAEARIGHFAEAQVLRAPLAAKWANVGA
jgi:pyridoxal biosynthesis lyase PdxS